MAPVYVALWYACFQPQGYVLDNSDCDDNREDSYPGAIEYCNGHDDNCDGVVDESYLSESCLSGALGICQVGFTQCEEGRVTCRSPLPEEESCDGLDNDCDGAIDESLTPPLTPLTQGVCAGQRQQCEGQATPSPNTQRPA